MLAVERQQKRYKLAREQAQYAKTILERTKAMGDVVMITNAESNYSEGLSVVLGKPEP